VFLFHEGRVLLVRRAPDAAILPGVYNGVGGHVESGEDLFGSARREVREETGLEVDELRLAGVLHTTEPGAPIGVVVFVMEGRAGSSEVGGATAGRHVWCAPAEAGVLPVAPDVPLLLSWAEASRPHGVFSARGPLSGSEPPTLSDTGVRSL
jgi:8-oxo-dGTP diphosphatase